MSSKRRSVRAVESSEEKRLDFACLSGAIEEVRAATSARKPALTRP